MMYHPIKYAFLDINKVIRIPKHAQDEKSSEILYSTVHIFQNNSAVLPPLTLTIYYNSSASTFSQVTFCLVHIPMQLHY